MTVTAVDVILGSLVIGLAGWALVQTGSARTGSRGCGGGCAGACGSGGQQAEEEPLVALGGRPDDPEREG
jgi:hypothetical protein